MIHHVFANKSNIGDWLSAIGIQKLLAPHPVQEHLCDEPFIDEAIDRLSRATAGDFVIIGGGGLFMDYFVPFWQRFLPLTERLPFGIWGVGYCDLKQQPSRPPIGLLEQIVARSRFCHVRDELTRQLLSRCTLPPPVGCPSMCAIERTADAGWGITHVDNYTTAGPDVFEAMDQLARDFASRTGRPYRRTNNRIEPGRRDELEHALDRYRQSDVILSSALHGCVISAALGKKVVAVSGDGKIDSFLGAIGLQDWVVDTTEVAHVADLLQHVARQHAPREQIERMISVNQRVAAEVLFHAAGSAGEMPCAP